MPNPGYIALHRSITEYKWHFLNNNREATKYETWIDLIMLANFKDKWWVGLKCHRGELLYSLQWYADRWRWDKGKVRRWFKKLEKHGSIRYKNETITTRITLVNYCRYQDPKNDNETDSKRKRNGSETQVKPTKEGKEREEGKGNSGRGKKSYKYTNPSDYLI